MAKSLLAVSLALGVAAALPREYEEYCQVDWLESHGQKRSNESADSPTGAHRRNVGDECNAEALSICVVSTGCPDEEPCGSRRTPDARPGGLSTDADEDDQGSPVMIGLLASVAAVFVVAGAAAFVVKRRVAARQSDGEKGDGGADAPPSGARPIPGIDIDSIRSDLDFAVEDEQVGSHPCVHLLGRTWPVTQTGSEPSKRAGSNGAAQASECGANRECPGSRFGKDDRIEFVDPEFGTAVQKSRSTGSTKSDASSPRPLEVRLTVSLDPSHFSA